MIVMFSKKAYSEKPTNRVGVILLIYLSMKEIRLLTLKKGVDINKNATQLVNALSSKALTELRGGSDFCDAVCLRPAWGGEDPCSSKGLRVCFSVDFYDVLIMKNM